MTKKTKNKEHDSWKYRRIATFISISFCMAVIGYAIIAGDDTKLMEAAVSGAFLSLSATLLTYLGASGVDDYLKGNK